MYTTDGKTWAHVAYLGVGDWNGVQATLPSFSWKDLATLQISIQSVPSSEDVPVVYLDSMWISVDYVSASPSPSAQIDSVLPSIVPTVFAPASQSQQTEVIAHFAGRDFASGLGMEDVSVTSVSNSYGQHGIVIRAGTISGISPDDIRQGWVSWSLVPASIDVSDAAAVRHYAFEHYFGLTNDPSDALLDNGTAIPDASMRIAVFSWICKTDSCDTEADVSPITFLSRETVNYHRIATGTSILLSAYR